MPHQAVWEKVNVTNPETGEDTIVTRGNALPEWVDDFTRFALNMAGAVQMVEEVMEPVPAPEPVRLQEHPPPNRVVQAAELPDMPSPGDDKATWVTYASHPAQPDNKRLDRDEANSMSKSALMDRFRN